MEYILTLNYSYSPEVCHKILGRHFLLSSVGLCNYEDLEAYPDHIRSDQSAQTLKRIGDFIDRCALRPSTKPLMCVEPQVLV
jgi:hypothetical protein